MRWGVLFLVVVTICAVILNVTTLKIGWSSFVGALLLALLFFGVVGNLIYKLILKKKGIKGPVENAFIFPNKLADKMKKVDLGIQYESSVVSISFLLVGIIAMDIYLVFFYSLSLPMKIFMAFNGICGVALMSSMLVTYYQQLVAYRESTKFLTNFAASQDNVVAKPNKKKNREPELPELPPLPPLEPNIPEGYYMADDGRYYDYEGNEVELVDDYDYKTERRSMR